MEASKRFSLGEFLEEGHDCDAWQDVDVDVLPDAIKQDTKSRIRAIKAFLKEKASLQEIQEKYGISRATLYRMIAKCMLPDGSDGVMGFRGAIPYVRADAKKYTRLKSVENESIEGSLGDAGAFKKLVLAHPELKTWLQTKARSYKPRREGGEHFSVLHDSFLQKCASLAVEPNRYPFNRKTSAASALRAYLIDQHKQLAAEAEKTYHDEQRRDIVPPLDVLQEVEADGHMIDIRLTIQENDSYGAPVKYEILRVWLIVLIDVYSRCVLGYSIAFGRNYDQVDLLNAVFNSVGTRVQPLKCVPGVEYNPAGGYPVDRIGAWETWSTLKLDNAWAHRAKHVVNVLHERIGCAIEFGKPHVPNDRPIVERFFLFIVQHFSHRIIGTTGSNSRDQIIKRLSPKSTDPLQMLLTIEELRSAIDIVLSDYNGRPHAGVQGHSPLEIFSLRWKERMLPPNTVAEIYRNDTSFVMVREPVTVKSNSKYGGAFINFQYLKYRNPDILRSDSVGRKVFIEYSRSDISMLRLLDEYGVFMGMLSSPHPWCLQPHSIKLRSEIWKALKDGQFKFARDETLYQALRRNRVIDGRVSRETATALYKETGRVSDEEKRPIRMPDTETPEPSVERVTLTKIFTF